MLKIRMYLAFVQRPKDLALVSRLLDQLNLIGGHLPLDIILTASILEELVQILRAFFIV
jgi:hypothetical protein